VGIRLLILSFFQTAGALVARRFVFAGNVFQRLPQAGSRVYLSATQ